MNRVPALIHASHMAGGHSTAGSAMDGQPRRQALLLLLTQTTDGLHRGDRKACLGSAVTACCGTSCCGHDCNLQFADLLPNPSARSQNPQSQLGARNVDLDQSHISRAHPEGSESMMLISSAVRSSNSMAS